MRFSEQDMTCINNWLETFKELLAKLEAYECFAEVPIAKILPLLTTDELLAIQKHSDAIDWDFITNFYDLRREWQNAEDELINPGSSDPYSAINLDDLDIL